MGGVEGWVGDDEDACEGWGVCDWAMADGAGDLCDGDGVALDVVMVFEGVVVVDGAWLVGDWFFFVLRWEDGVV